MIDQILNNAAAFLGVVISSIVSFLISRLTAKNEIKKMRLTWEREDTLAKSSDMAKMIQTVSLYCGMIEADPDIIPDKEYSESLAQVDHLRSVSDGDLAKSLDKLSASLNSGPSEIKRNLDDVIHLIRVSRENSC